MSEEYHFGSNQSATSRRYFCNVERRECGLRPRNGITRWKMPRDDACANWRRGTDEKQCLTMRGVASLDSFDLSRPPEASVSLFLPPLLFFLLPPPRCRCKLFNHAFTHRPVLGQIYKRVDRFLPRYAHTLPPYRASSKKFRNFRRKKVPSTYLFYAQSARRWSA